MRILLTVLLIPAFARCTPDANDDLDLASGAAIKPPPGVVDGSLIPANIAWGFSQEEEGFGVDFAAGGVYTEGCSQKCTGHWHRTCTHRVVNGRMVRDDSTCTPWVLTDVDCREWICPPGVTPPSGGGLGAGFNGNPPPVGSSTGQPPAGNGQARCTACMTENEVALKNADNTRDSCYRAAQSEATRRCKAAGTNTTVCRNFITKGLPIGVELSLPGIAITDILPEGERLNKMCDVQHNEATVAAWMGYEGCLRSNGCI